MKSILMHPTTDCDRLASTEGIAPLPGGRVFLSLGSNLGDRERYLAQARIRLQEEPGIWLLRASPILENRAILFENQPDFLNQIMELRTELPPLDLLHLLKRLEREIGRQERFRFGPREIDLDILTYDCIILDDPILTLPHPGLFDRDYIHALLRDLNESVASVFPCEKREIPPPTPE